MNKPAPSTNSGGIAIVGMACRFAGANNLQEYWRLLVEGKDGFGPSPANRWDHEAFFDANPRKVDKNYAPVGGFIDDIHSFPSVALQIPPRRVEVMDPQQRMALEMSLQAVEDSGRNAEDLPRRTGVYMGVTAVEWRTLATARVVAQMMACGEFGDAPEDAQMMADSINRIAAPRPFSAPGLLGNMCAANIAQELRLTGPAYSTDAACASAVIAIYDAITALRSGAIDCALAGGVYLSITPEQYIAFSRIGAMSRHGKCRPFDEEADGFVQGDGAGVIMLKRVEDAIRDNDRIYAVIHGAALNNDGGGDGPMAPRKEGQKEVITLAWEDAGLEPGALGYIEAHGTGTSVGDGIEFEGLAETVGLKAARAAIGSSKANVGHTMSCAGVAGVIRAALSLHHKTITPMAGFEKPKADLPLSSTPFFFPKESESWTDPARLACVSSFGFGGTNGHLVMGAFAEPSIVEEQSELILLSAPDLESLRELAGRTAQAIEFDPSATVAGVARAWALRRRQPARLGVVASTRKELIARLQAASEGRLEAGMAIGEAPEIAPKVAFMFPGQGAQRTGMIAKIRERFPIVAQTLEEVDRALEGRMDIPVTHLLYPELRGEQDAEKAIAELTDTANCQPALFAVGVALARLLESIGVRPSITTGHSIGEFTAGAVSGLLSLEDGARFTAARGQAMAAMTGDTGAMVALVTDRKIAEGLLVDGAVIANMNHPKQVVVSGTTQAINKVAGRAEEQGIKAVILRVSHGFHSPIFESLDLTKAIDVVDFRECTIPVASGIADHAYTSPEDAKRVYKRHATSPVNFIGALEQCRAEGASVFLQVNPGGPLLSFARGTLEDVSILGLASSEDDDGVESLLHGLAELWVRGVGVDVRPISADAPLASVPPLVLPRTVHWMIKDQPSHVALSGPTERHVSAPAAAPKVVEVEPDPSDGVADLVLKAIAKASAYPIDSLRAEMQLVNDLGFDSMMVSDLAEEMARTVPGVQGIPRELLINSPSIQDLIDFAKGESNKESVDEDDDAPLHRYVPIWVPAPALNTVRTVANLSVLAGPDASSELASALKNAGLPVVLAESPEDQPNADALIYVSALTDPIPVNAVLAGEAAMPDPTEDFMTWVDAYAALGKTPGIIALRRDDDVWSEGISGAIRAISQEWTNPRIASIRTPHVTVDELAQRILVEFTEGEKSVDIRYVDGLRSVAGTKRIAEVATPYEPTSEDTVLITGGTRGIGLKLAQHLAEQGARVLVLGRSTPEVLPKGVEFVQGDVSDLKGLKDTLTSVGPVHVTIHAAGLLADGALGTVDAKEARVARDVKVRGWLNVIDACGPSLRVLHGVGSWAGRFGNRHQAHYAAANALMAALSEQNGRVRTVVSEFGPWTTSTMVESIPKAIQATMRQEGVDFVGDEAGLQAILEDLGGQGPLIRGRRMPSRLRRVEIVDELSLATHPYLKDHAVQERPTLPMASAADMLASAAGLTTPFEVVDLTLFQGISLEGDESVRLTTNYSAGRAELRSGDKNTLCYRALVQPLQSAVEVFEPLVGGTTPELSLESFYEDVTFHGPMLQGIVSIDGVTDSFVRGRVRTGRPKDWMKAPRFERFAVDPLAFDSAMQLSAYSAWVRFKRAGTPVGFDRYVQLHPFPDGELIAEVRFGESESDKFSADITFRDDSGKVYAMVENVVAQLQKVESDAPVKPDAWKGFDVKEEWVNPAAWPGYKDLELRLQMAEAMGLKNPYFDLHEGTARNTSVIDGREVIHFSGYNYLGLSGDERVLHAVKEAVDKYGTSVSASRVAGGERPFHRELERELADAQGVEDAVVMAAGHATNVTTIGHLFNPKDLILHDELIHDSCLQGIKLSGAARRSFRHEDFDHLEAQLKELRPRFEKVLILIEGVYSMDGDVANLPKFLELKKKYGTLIMVDEAHSFGTIGKTGCGAREHFGIDGREVDIWMGTMSKSLASMGGWIAGSKELIQYIRYTTPGFVFAAGTAPALGAAALASIRIWRSTDTWRVEKLQANCRLFHTLLTERGLNTGPARGESPVIPVVTGDSMQALYLSQRLLEQGINAKPIVFPAVADDAARLRFFINSTHTEEQLVHTATAISTTLTEIRAELG